MFRGIAPWTVIEGDVVCPECQTPSEERDAARRIVGAIEAEIARSIDDSNPTPPEPGLIAYAMELRERLESTPPPPEPTPQAGPEPEPRVGDHHVAITAAFLTGHPLHIAVSEYEQLQRDLGRQLKRGGGRGWSVTSDKAAHWRQDGTYHSGGGFANMLPLILARRDGPEVLRRATTILRSRPNAEKRWLEIQTPGWEISLVSIRIDVYDLGMAIMNGIFRIQPPSRHPLNATARLVKRLVWLKPDPEAGVCSPIAETFRELAEETTREFEAAVRVVARHTIQRPWLSPFLDALSRTDPNARARPDDWGRLLWLHPVHMVRVGGNEDLAPVATQLAAPFHRSLEVLDGRFVPGIGWSVLVKTRDLAETNIPLRLIELQWAYMALYMEIDRGLLALLDSERWEQEASLAELEDDADNVFADFMRVMEGRARVDSVLATLGGDEQAIWDVVADVTKFGALIDGVDRKVDVLQRVAERRVQQAAAAQARRTSAILSFLTALTLVTVTVALLGNFLGTRSDVLGHIEIRVLSVAAALLASIGLYRAAFREQPNRETKRRRKRARHG